MKSTILGSAATLLALAGSPGIAQAPPQVMMPVAVPVVAVQPPTTNAVLRIGTEIPLRLVEELTTKEKMLRVGSRFRMETSEPVMVQGVTVIPVGSPAVGEISDVRNKGMWGKSGRLVARLLYVTANGRQVRLSGGFDDKGTAGGVGATAVSAIIFLPAGFFMTGTSAKIPMGTVVKGFIDEDVPLSIPSETQVMVVGAPPAPMAVAPPTAAAAPEK